MKYHTASCLSQPIYIDGLVQERCNSSALAMKLHHSCIDLLNYDDNEGINFLQKYHSIIDNDNNL